MPNMAITLILLGIGVVLFIVEMFTPGLGIAGLLGIIALFAAVLLQISNPVGILFMLALVLFLIAVAVLVFFRLATKGKLDKSNIVLKDRINGESTDIGTQSTKSFVGAVGLALTPLRPAGKALVLNKMLDVSTLGEFLPSGARVEVTEAVGLRIVVRNVSDDVPITVEGSIPRLAEDEPHAVL